MNCPRKYCTGMLLSEPDDFGKTVMVCSLCSRRFTETQLKEGIKEPDMSKGLDVHAKHLFIEEHRADIIADYLTIGTTELLEKWKLSVSGWRPIKKRWATDIETAKQKFPVIAEAVKKIRVPAVGDKRRKGYKAEGWSDPVKGREYAELKARYDGYRQAVLDIFGQQNVEVNPEKE